MVKMIDEQDFYYKGSGNRPTLEGQKSKVESVASGRTMGEYKSPNLLILLSTTWV